MNYGDEIDKILDPSWYSYQNQPEELDVPENHGDEDCDDEDPNSELSEYVFASTEGFNGTFKEWNDLQQQHEREKRIAQTNNIAASIFMRDKGINRAAYTRDMQDIISRKMHSAVTAISEASSNMFTMTYILKFINSWYGADKKGDAIDSLAYAMPEFDLNNENKINEIFIRIKKLSEYCYVQAMADGRLVSCLDEDFMKVACNIVIGAAFIVNECVKSSGMNLEDKESVYLKSLGITGNSCYAEHVTDHISYQKMVTTGMNGTAFEISSSFWRVYKNISHEKDDPLAVQSHTIPMDKNVLCDDQTLASWGPTMGV
jgi:hypothetical protein